MGYIATMDHVGTIIILFELNTYCYTRPNVYMYMCSLGIVIADPMGNCL